jgi:ABC-2 type transport system ATP-binding protein
VTLSITQGTVFGLLDPNGGKTTTIKMIAGLIVPTARRIRLGGFDVARQRREAVRQIGAVLEGSRNVYWPLPTWQNLLYFGRLKSCSPAAPTPTTTGARTANSSTPPQPPAPGPPGTASPGRC